jgi:hypothetical protein
MGHRVIHKKVYMKNDTTAARERLAKLRSVEMADRVASRHIRYEVIEDVHCPARPASSPGLDYSIRPMPKPVGVIDFDQAVTSLNNAAMAVASVSGCRWPIGHPRGTGAFRFCNKNREPGAPYCLGHCARAFML